MQLCVRARVYHVCVLSVQCLQRKVQDAAAKKRKVDTSAQELRALEHKNLEAVMRLPRSRQRRT